MNMHVNKKSDNEISDFFILLKYHIPFYRAAFFARRTGRHLWHISFKYFYPMKNKIIFSLVACCAISSFSFVVGCSTTNGKQESAVDHENVSRDLTGTVADVNVRTQAVFKEMGIGVTGTQTKASSQEQEVTGVSGGKTVTVQMNPVGEGMTHVEITAKEGTFQWDQDYAKEVLKKIIAKS